MNTIQLIIKEILHRKLNFSLSLLAIVTAVALFVSFFTTGEASKRETIRLMRDMGYNLRIIHKDTDMNAFFLRGYSDITMPHDYVHILAKQDMPNFLYTHLLATYQHNVQWRGTSAIIKGIAAEVMPVNKSKPSMIFTIEPGTAYLGYELAKRFNLSQGDSIEVMGKTFTVERTLYESGTEDDIRIYVHLSDAQELFDQEGKINEIMALDCRCLIENVDPLELLRKQLAKTLPDTRVIQIRNIAQARTEQREMMDQYFAMIMPIIIIVCAIWIGALAMLNVRDRRQEIGVFRALGYRSGKIAGLFLGKALLIGVLGALIGFLIGTILALIWGPAIFKVTASKISPIYSLLVWSIIVAPLFAALSSFIPAALAITQDPADVLREE